MASLGRAFAAVVDGCVTNLTPTLAQFRTDLKESAGFALPEAEPTE